ncbi:Uncharacterized protein RNJ44_01836 [Nakaseomyces bracarensis]|uniref:Uncharacterized protein n=1 Tax=Nakaseomyces bracarensis TaxID=273131 RepID=A0ABR4NP19_9SACH
MDYVPPQKLDSNVYFGSLTTLTDPLSLQQRNIRYFIGVDIPSIVFANAYDMLCRPYNEELVMANLENDMLMNTNECHDENTEELISKYRRNNTYLLQKLQNGGNEVFEKYTTAMVTPPVTPVGSRSHQRFSYLDGEKPVNGALGMQVSSNTFNEYSLDRFKIFNELISLFRNTNGNDNILVVSESGNDHELITLLISLILKKDPSIAIMDALQFVKCCRVVDEPILKEEQIFWSSGLIGYHEHVKTTGMFWGPGSSMGHLAGSPVRTNRKNRNTDSQDQIVSPTAKIASSDGCFQRRIASCKRVRF